MKIVLIYESDIMNISITELKTGEKAKILGFKPGLMPYLHRLLSLGLTPDTELTLVRAAPLGDPIEIRVHDFFLCLRKQEALILDLERIG
jgi:ferrous iron transport protein A